MIKKLSLWSLCSLSFSLKMFKIIRFFNRKLHSKRKIKYTRKGLNRVIKRNPKVKISRSKRILPNLPKITTFLVLSWELKLSLQIYHNLQKKSRSMPIRTVIFQTSLLKRNLNSSTRKMHSQTFNITKCSGLRRSQTLRVAF